MKIVKVTQFRGTRCDPPAWSILAYKHVNSIEVHFIDWAGMTQEHKDEMDRINPNHWGLADDQGNFSDKWVVVTNKNWPDEVYAGLARRALLGEDDCS